jgi:hypothetical protein
LLELQIDGESEGQVDSAVTAVFDHEDDISSLSDNQGVISCEFEDLTDDSEEELGTIMEEDSKVYKEEEDQSLENLELGSMQHEDTKDHSEQAEQSLELLKVGPIQQENSTEYTEQAEQSPELKEVDTIHLVEPLHIELGPIQQEENTAFTEQLEQPLSHIELGPIQQECKSAFTEQLEQTLESVELGLIQQEDKTVSKEQLDQPLVHIALGPIQQECKLAFDEQLDQPLEIIEKERLPSPIEMQVKVRSVTPDLPSFDPLDDPSDTESLLISGETTRKAEETDEQSEVCIVSSDYQRSEYYTDSETESNIQQDETNLLSVNEVCH